MNFLRNFAQLEAVVSAFMVNSHYVLLGSERPGLLATVGGYAKVPAFLALFPVSVIVLAALGLPLWEACLVQAPIFGMFKLFASKSNGNSGSDIRSDSLVPFGNTSHFENIPFSLTSGILKALGTRCDTFTAHFLLIVEKTLSAHYALKSVIDVTGS